MMNPIEFLRLGIDFAVLRRERPYVLGLAVTDICNLACRHCRVSNTRHEMMSFARIRATLETAWRRGARVVYFEGGEPYLWRDGRRRLADLVALARELRFLSVHVYTNGTRPLTAPADFTWVSIDGTEESNQRLRGTSAEAACDRIAASALRCGVVCTVNSVNADDIDSFLRFIERRLPGRRVMFFFHTPYYGIDDLHLSPGRKREAIRRLMACKRAGLPVMNSHAGLKAMASGDYPHPTALFQVTDASGDYACCRAVARPDVCRHCGYSSCAEITLARDFRPGPLLSILHTW